MFVALTTFVIKTQTMLVNLSPMIFYRVNNEGNFCRAVEKEKRDQERRGKYLRKQMEREKSLSAVREK